VLALRDAPVRQKDGSLPLRASDVKGEVVFEDVDFAYEGREPLFRRFSLRIPAGQTTAVVGVTGVGKTTLAKLLLRFHDVTGGRILLDGVDIRELRMRDLRDAVGLMTQEVFLFDGTVRDNIAYGSFGAGDEAIARAAELAEVRDFIEGLPQRYDTLIGERGVKLSGGQRQRISLARVILKNAPLLVLDEATAAVDNETEAAIQRALRRVSAGRTTLVIAHRLSTVRHADCIHVLGEGGVLLEQGRHEELLRKDGPYAALWRVQTGDAPLGDGRAEPAP